MAQQGGQWEAGHGGAQIGGAPTGGTQPGSTLGGSPGSAVAASLGPPARAADWAARPRPAAGPALAIGAHGLGCVQGAASLPAEGPGFQSVRRSRNRHWGHPALVDWVRGFALKARGQGFPDLWTGDLGQPRGGPMPWGHASHQSGLDVDVWLDLHPKPLLPAAQREEIAVASLVRADEREVDPATWTPRHAALIRLAAEQPGVDRILVHHAIKRRLCADHAGAPWLRRVRPWRGHESHMHVRMACPAGQPLCQDQAPPPAGDGCDASLAWWLTPEARQPPPRPPAGAPPPPPPRLPAACAAVLSAP